MWWTGDGRRLTVNGRREHTFSASYADQGGLRQVSLLCALSSVPSCPRLTLYFALRPKTDKCG